MEDLYKHEFTEDFNNWYEEKSKYFNVTPYHKLIPAGEVSDVNGLLVGRFVFLWHPDQQELFDKYCEAWLKTAEIKPEFFITRDYETTGLSGISHELILACISWNATQSIIVVIQNFDTTLWSKVLEKIKINNVNNKFDSKFDINYHKVNPNLWFDPFLAAQVGYMGYLKNYGLEPLISLFLDQYKVNKETRMDFPNMVKLEYNNIIYWAGKDKSCPGLENVHISYGAQDALFTHRLVRPLMHRLEQEKLVEIFNREITLSKIFAQIEHEGYPIDFDYLEKITIECQQEVNSLELSIISKVTDLIKEGVVVKNWSKDKKSVFNPNAPAQIISLMRQLGVQLPNLKEDTVEEYLAKIANNKSIPIDCKELFVNIVNYRQKRSYLSKFLIPWTSTHVNVTTKRLHPTIKIMVPETGRMASSDPNIMATTPSIRPAIIADEGCLLSTRDYSAYEFRAMAANSKDPYLVQAFSLRHNAFKNVNSASQILQLHTNNDVLINYFKEKDSNILKDTLLDLDVTSLFVALNHHDLGDILSSELVDSCIDFASNDLHKKVASLLFDVEPLQVTKPQRKVAKTLGYAVLYLSGISTIQAQLMKEGLYYTETECKTFVNLFNEKLKGVFQFIEYIKNEIRTKKYIKTYMGRKKYFNLPQTWAYNYDQVLNDSYRQGVNATGQVANADAIKLSMIKLYDIFNNEFDEKERPKIFFPVHDELVIQSAEHLIHDVYKIQGEVMTECGELAIGNGCPVEVSGAISKHWSK